jgi:hypothetical protein
VELDTGTLRGRRKDTKLVCPGTQTLGDHEVAEAHHRSLRRKGSGLVIGPSRRSWASGGDRLIDVVNLEEDGGS